MNNRALSILVADDVPEIVELMSDYLRACGHQVQSVLSLSELEEIWSTVYADIVILDIVFQDGDGREMAERLRIQDEAGLIYVTSKDSQSDRVRALDDGGDDYITKPINLRELAARVRSVARRRAKEAVLKARPRVPIGEHHINLVMRQIEGKSAEAVPLTGGEFALLLLLLSKAGAPCSRDELAEAISAGSATSPNTRTVDVIVARLRHKTVPLGKAFPEILTIRNQGYALRTQIVR
ncbi:response regulator transcription factor [Gluconobacter sp. OJB]|uniref:response regulator transcription factor n=1 Tax=Gluconobacter sp. OJB TaxID=3145196 RepID=UPI0031F819E2